MVGARVTLKEIEDEVNKSTLQKVEDKNKSLKGKKNTTIEGFDFSVNGKDLKMCTVTDCEDVVIRRCRFSGKNLKDVALHIKGAKTKRVTVEFCIFENMDTDLKNGGEPLRLGNSQFSGCSFESTVRKCIFRNLKADPETISIKSAKNIVEDCYHINNESMITVRHGGLAEIRFNTFQGKGGVRLLGFGNKVHDNLFEENKETGKFSPIQVQNGSAKQDKNWTDGKTPSDKEGSTHAVYARCVANEITANEFRDCKTKIFFRTDKPLSPKNLKVDHTLPQPSEPEDEEEEQEPQIPEQPEPQTPTESSDDPPTHGRLCQVGHDEEAKLRVAIYVCRRHLDDVKPRIQKLLDEIRAAAESGQIKVEVEEEV
jgi:hypothetical protein